MHRTCFKCARCYHQLSIANYYETESGDYCCEMCPDEEIEQTEVAEANKKIVESEQAVVIFFFVKKKPDFLKVIFEVFSLKRNWCKRKFSHPFF